MHHVLAGARGGQNRCQAPGLGGYSGYEPPCGSLELRSATALTSDSSVQTPGVLVWRLRWRRSGVLILGRYAVSNSIGSHVCLLCWWFVGGTRSVARELGGLGSSSDWASVLL